MHRQIQSQYISTFDPVTLNQGRGECRSHTFHNVFVWKHLLDDFLWSNKSDINRLYTQVITFFFKRLKKKQILDFIHVGHGVNFLTS